MGLLDNLTSSLQGVLSGSGGAAAQGAIGSALESTGGVQGILDKLQAGGFSSVVSSWTAEGTSQSISVDQLKGALGSDHIEQIASSLGVSPDKALAALAEHLPGLAATQGKS